MQHFGISSKTSKRKCSLLLMTHHGCGEAMWSKPAVVLSEANSVIRIILCGQSMLRWVNESSQSCHSSPDACRRSQVDRTRGSSRPASHRSPSSNNRRSPGPVNKPSNSNRASSNDNVRSTLSSPWVKSDAAYLLDRLAMSILLIGEGLTRDMKFLNSRLIQ